jgi:TonB family protein
MKNGNLFAMALGLSLAGHALIFAAGGLGFLTAPEDSRNVTTITFEASDYRELPTRYLRSDTTALASSPEPDTGNADTGPGRAGDCGNEPADETTLRLHEIIKQRIEAHRVYPPSAKKRKLQGSARLAFTLAPSGPLRGLPRARASGPPLLDRAALDTIRAAAPFPADDSADAVMGRFLIVDIDFRL